MTLITPASIISAERSSYWSTAGNDGARYRRPSASHAPQSASDPARLDAGQRFNRPSSAHSRRRCPSHRLSAERSAPTNSP
jgi:hypothetical protein